jgi:hypothetical protein
MWGGSGEAVSEFEIRSPDLTELATTFFTGCSDLTRYLSAFRELTMSFFP